MDVCCLDICSNHLLVIIKDNTVKYDLGLSTVALNSHCLKNVHTDILVKFSQTANYKATNAAPHTVVCFFVLQPQQVPRDAKGGN